MSFHIKVISVIYNEIIVKSNKEVKKSNRMSTVNNQFAAFAHYYEEDDEAPSPAAEP